MYTGLIPRFPRNRELTELEHTEALSRTRQPGVDVNERSGLISFNSTYIDWIDRQFSTRGMLKTVMATIIWFFFLLLTGFFVVNWMLQDPEVVWWFWPCVAFVGLLASIFPYWFFLRYEFFAYTHYPIRLNRKTRMVHVFRRNGKNGVLSIPWDEIFFHLGHGTDPVTLRDIRGEILDGDIVKDTFALGHFFERPQPVLEMWEFIRRYMEEGPEAVAENPLDRYVSLSVTGSFKNCMIMSRIFYGADSPFAQAISLPLVALSTVTRWLIFKTCKVPVFPREIEAECVVEANDPNVWPIPESSGQFAAENPAIMQRAVKRSKKAASR
ncbi:hypothetical protein LT85_2327 [Collimonas arenae]|uniref:DUF6708 domain-containing protein n=1 Tax=Collimonas arenae TaxID=279058 RepID=A0A0A1FCI0_9BURK|nr:DUF6708 domain-containing protein [Collimonas arenae]AIY41485.1 hypothetical protein LT85_2327 [Collimonas arenae]